MEEQIVKLQGIAGSTLNVYVWRPKGETKAVLHIVHGMAEHAARYKHFAEFLTNEGYVVYAHDHRKHGKSIKEQEKVGILDKTDNFDHIVEDMHCVHAYIKAQQPNKQLIVLGHSLGSLLLRRYLQKYGHNVDKAIIMGTSFAKPLMCRLGIVLGKLMILCADPSKRSRFLNNLTVNGFNEDFRPKRTEFDWISRDEAQVDLYINDPLCGYAYNPLFYYELSKLVLLVHHKSKIKKMPHIPMLLISGREDPVGNKGVGVQQVYNLLTGQGYSNITSKLFEGARHEVLNEINREAVYRYIVEWMQSL